MRLSENKTGWQPAYVQNTISNQLLSQSITFKDRTLNVLEYTMFFPHGYLCGIFRSSSFEFVAAAIIE
jgi:hypothetical protein